VLVAVRYAGQ